MAQLDETLHSKSFSPGLDGSWRLMSSHGAVLFYVAANPDSTMRQIAEELEITERRVYRIVKDLSQAGMLDVSRIGRRNSYKVNEDAHFRHRTLSDVKLGVFVEALAK